MATLKSKHFIFHSLLKQFKENNIKKKHLLVGVSGGMDSVALLNIILELKNILHLQVSVVHIHHGEAKTKTQNNFRDKAAQTIKDFCAKKDITFYSSKKTKITASSEAALRKYRYKKFLAYIKTSQADYLTLAHTTQDLLETRLIRLIRGTGEQGIEAMSFKKNNILRPFIYTSRVKIKDYVIKQKIKWCEDPSNKSINYSFRNWIRHKWLPLLEKKRSGCLVTLARSLDLISHKAIYPAKNDLYKNLIKKQSLKRDIIFTFSKHQAQKIVAFYIKNQGFTNYSASHILELIKQMERPQKTFNFFLLGKFWKITPHWLSFKKDKKNTVEK